MVKTSRGYAPQAGYMKHALAELHRPDMPAYDLIEYEPLIDSSDISVQDWVKIAQDIEMNHKTYDGFVILHGTDTMAYTASALSFMLEELDKPVVLTGSQIPLCEIRNDARDNVIVAMMIAANSNIPEVCLYFENKLMRGNRTKKVSADQLIAFDSPNYPVLADVGVRMVYHQERMRTPGEGLNVFPIEEHPVAVLRLFPGIQLQVVENIISFNVKAIVIEAFGAGNIPGRNKGFLQLLEMAKETGTLILVCTQCFRGAARLGLYESSQELIKAGAVSCHDMTVEAVVTKLFYLLSKYDDLEMVKKYLEIDLRGELTVF